MLHPVHLYRVHQSRHRFHLKVNEGLYLLVGNLFPGARRSFPSDAEVCRFWATIHTPTCIHWRNFSPVLPAHVRRLYVHQSNGHYTASTTQDPLRSLHLGSGPFAPFHGVAAPASPSFPALSGSILSTVLAAAGKHGPATMGSVMIGGGVAVIRITLTFFSQAVEMTLRNSQGHRSIIGPEPIYQEQGQWVAWVLFYVRTSQTG